ncbi:MAG: bifunctional glutamate N-acetyltransferase/amino-acid acetyltransferase ArgJ [Alphaproteobacteria bacterium]|nr:bifunctional glutamate N-acetyltransferase/amino-acid acetyltransferase ArgJ [Alphaproteobacteria bacterium]
MTQISPLAPEHIVDLPPVAGVRLAATYAAIRYKTPRPDLMLALLDEGTTVAGVFTLSLAASAPVERGRWALKAGGGKARALVVNAGNSNAFTGKSGEKAVDETVAAAAAVAGCKPEEVFVASTGVIGEKLPFEKITAVLPDLAEKAGDGGWDESSRSILTTDTFAKRTFRKVQIGGKTVTLSGFAKGSGMIAPHMGTMLAFLFTDAAIAPDVLQTMLQAANDKSFNAITVDSDTSTSDTALLFATGKAGNASIESLTSEDAETFAAALDSVMLELAHLIIKDGEGASKFVAIEVTGAADDAAARRIGLAIGNSPLVKTAIAGCDPNWGRLVMAVGKAGEKADRDNLAIWIGGVLVAENGEVSPDYREPPTAEYMKGRDIHIRVDVAVGKGEATIWTCDFTKRYIEINADYRS